MTNSQTYYGLVWLDGMEPKKLLPETAFDEMQALQFAMRMELDLYTHGKIVADRGEGTFELYYRAFTDPFRNRQIVSGVDAADVERNLLARQKELTVKCFTPRELYALKPVRVHYDLYHFLRVHLQGEITAWALDQETAEKLRSIEIHDLADECADGRRTWTLQTVWFLGKPVMVVNSSGRDGSEYSDRYITDREEFECMLVWLRTFIRSEELADLVNADKVIPDMTEFYDATIHDYYDVEKQEAKRRKY